MDKDAALFLWLRLVLLVCQYVHPYSVTRIWPHHCLTQSFSPRGKSLLFQATLQIHKIGKELVAC